MPEATSRAWELVQDLLPLWAGGGGGLSLRGRSLRAGYRRPTRGLRHACRRAGGAVQDQGGPACSKPYRRVGGT